MKVRYEDKPYPFLNEPMTRLTLKEGNSVVAFVAKGSPKQAMLDFIRKARAGVCYELLEVEYYNPKEVSSK